MSKRTIFTALLCLAMGMSLIGCAQFDRVAIEKSRAYTTGKEQVEYLLSEANRFLNMEKYDEAINVANYILANLDPNSVEAKDIIKKAKAGIEEFELYRLIHPHYYFGDKAGVWKHKWWEFGPGTW